MNTATATPQDRYDSFRRGQVASAITERVMRTGDFAAAVATIRHWNDGEGLTFDGPAEFDADTATDRYARYSRQTLPADQFNAAVQDAQQALRADGWSV